MQRRFFVIAAACLLYFAAMSTISAQIKDILHRFIQVNGIRMHLAEQEAPAEMNRLMGEFLASVYGKGRDIV